MSSETTRRVATTIDDEGVASGASLTSPVDNKVRAEVVVPPNVVVPIVFVPGIMGSNLRDSRTKESVWNVSSVISLAWQWAFRSSKTRQVKLNPETTEVDPTGRVQVPDAGGLVGDKKTALKRGWGSVAKAGYGDFMAWLDVEVNVDEASPWQHLVGDAAPWERQTSKPSPKDASGEQPYSWNPERSFQVLTGDESEHAFNLLCPLHGVGYNWLQSNGESGKYLADQIDKIIAYWANVEHDGEKRYRCEKVIVVTHSMGGLVTRAAAHDSYGGAQDKMLGVAHGVLPANGSGAAYHHVRAGYSGLSKYVLGRNAGQITAIFANAAGPLELLPNHQYGNGWLQARNAQGDVLMSLPQADPYSEVYYEEKCWWRLVDDRLIDPGKIHQGGEIPRKPREAYLTQLLAAETFHKTLGTAYHPVTYAHYGADPGLASYQNVVWKTSGTVRAGSTPLLVEATGGDDSNPVVLQLGGDRLEFEIADPAEAGDDTVPANSGAGPALQGQSAVAQSFRMNQLSKAHAASYDDVGARQITMYVVGKLLRRMTES